MRIRPVLAGVTLAFAAACSPPNEAGLDDAKLSVEKPELLAMAKVKDDAARKLAAAAVPGGRIVSAELEEEDGVLLYSYDLKVGDKSGVDEVHVDAGTGDVVKVTHEDPRGGIG